MACFCLETRGVTFPSTLHPCETRRIKRDALLAELQKLETEISKAFGSGTATETAIASLKTGNGCAAAGSSAKVAKGKKASVKRGKRGAVKELILARLQDAGEARIAVKHLAAKLAIKRQNIHVWLHTTGKKSGLVEAAGKDIYRLKQSVGVETPIATAPNPKVAREVEKEERFSRKITVVSAQRSISFEKTIMSKVVTASKTSNVWVAGGGLVQAFATCFRSDANGVGKRWIYQILIKRKPARTMLTASDKSPIIVHVRIRFDFATISREA